MKIIVASFSKTGTKSLNAALTLLGYNVYDYLEHFWYHEKQWKEIFETGGSTEMFKQMYQDVDVVLDMPVFHFWDDIHQAFPDAKIILCIRDEDSWMKSVKSEMTSYFSSFWFNIIRYFSPIGRRFYRHIIWGQCVVLLGRSPATPSDVVNERVMRKKYRQHNLDVLQNAPKDKLFVFNIKEGWEPLCEFLGHDVPDAPFPRKNVGGQLITLSMKENAIMQRMVTEAKLSMSVVFVLILAGGYFAYKKIPFRSHFQRVFSSFRLG